MRNMLVVLILASRLVCSAQIQAGKAIELTYTYVNVGMGEQRKASLIFRGQESLTIFSPKDSLATGGSPRDFDISGEDSRGRQFYKHSGTGLVMFRDFVPDGKGFEPCIVNDPMEAMIWKHSSETKVIGKYLCKGAATEFRGRKYVAWYTEDIPVSHGPWKFYGLPGAIIEIHSTDRNIQFTLARIDQRSGSGISPPSGEKLITMAEYVRRREQGLEDFLSALSAKLPRGAQVTATQTGDYNLEIDFTDVKK